MMGPRITTDRDAPAPAKWKESAITSVSISGKHRTMIDIWQCAMELAAGKTALGAPSVREAAESLIELGWACAHLPAARRVELIKEAMDGAEAGKADAEVVCRG